MKRWMVPAGAALLFLAAAVLLWPGRRSAPEPEGSGTAGEEPLSVCLVGGAGAGVYDPSLLEEAAGAGAYVCCLDQGEPADLTGPGGGRGRADRPEPLPGLRGNLAGGGPGAL